MLRKMTFLAGAGVGYVMGTRGGREQYQKIQESAKKMAERPEVQQAMEKAAPLGDKVKTMASGKIRGIGGDKADTGGTGGSAGTGAAGETPGDADANPSHDGSNIPPRGTFSPVRGSF